MSFVEGMECKSCGQSYELKPIHICESCFGPLKVKFDYESMRGKVTRESISKGPRSIWRYKDFLPIEGEPVTGHHSGWTPLRRSHRLADELGCRELWIKDDSVNCPSLSYKERVVSVAISKAVEFGLTTVGCASTGNLANSVAAHAAEAGLEAIVVIPDDLELGKIIGSLVYAPHVIRVRGNYDQVNRLCTQIASKYSWAMVNVNLRPFYTEGAKTHGFEVAEQLGWRLPQNIVVPTAGGTLLPKIWESFQELKLLGLVDDIPCRVFSAQAAGCDPVVKAVHNGEDDIEPQKPNTIAKSIAIGDPADGRYVIDAVKESGGWAESVSDEEIIDAIQLLARTEGVWTEPAGGTTLAVTRKLLQQGRIDPDESIVVSITGNGLKTSEVLNGRLPEIRAIGPKIEEFDSLLSEERLLSDVASTSVG